MHFRNTTKNCSTSSCSQPFLIFTFELPSQTELLSNYELFMYFCFCFFFHSYGSFNCANSTSLSFSEFSKLFISILLLSQHRKSFCTFICLVSLLTSSCQFFMNPSCSLLPCASLMFIWYLFIMLPQGSLGFLSVPH